MRVLLSHVYSWPEVRRGGERYLHELGAALVRAGHDAQIVSTDLTGSTDEVLGVPVTRFRRTRDDFYGAEAAFARRAALEALRHSYDAWHAFGTADARAAALVSRLGRTRSLHTDLGGPLRSYRESRPDHRKFAYAVKHLDVYACLSQATGDLLARDYGRDAVVIPGGVDLARFHPTVPPTEEPTVLFASDNAEPRKNLPLLLAAFDLLLARRPARLVLAGPGDPRPALDQSTDRVRAATETAPVDGDLTDLYSAAWVTALPSMREAFGLVLVESLACGTPVVAIAGSGGPAEIVRPGLGALAAEPTPAALADALDEALALGNVGGACRTEASRYSWDAAVVPRLLELYAG